MRLRIALAVGVALVVSYAATAILGLAFLQERDATRKTLAANQAALQSLQLEVRAARSEVATLASRFPQTNPPPLPSSSAPVFPTLNRVADDRGDVWLGGTTGGIVAPEPVKVGTSITLTASASDPLNRALQFQFFSGAQPTTRLLRDWGGPVFTWVAGVPPGVTAPATVNIDVAVKDSDPTHRYPTVCYLGAPCDDFIIVTYNVTP